MDPEVAGSKPVTHPIQTRNTATRCRKGVRRLVSKLGIVNEPVVPHSLRHDGISKLTGVGWAHNVYEMLAGRAASGVYGHVYVHRGRIPLSLLREGLEKLRYDDVLTVLTKEALEAIASSAAPCKTSGRSLL